MRRVLAAVILLFCVTSIQGCGGPITNSLHADVENDVPARPSWLFNGPTSCQTDQAPYPSIYFAPPVCTKYYLGTQYYSASDIDALPDTAASDAQTRQNLQIAYVSAALIDSREKCVQFVDLFTAGQNGSDWTLDTAGIVLSGLGAIMTPVETVRALSAASTGVQSFKQTTNSDLFQNLTMVLLVQQIQTSYFDKMDAAFPTVPPPNTPDFSASASLAEIEDIHRNCSVPFTVAALSAKAALPASPVPAPIKRWMVKLSGSFTAGDTITLLPSGSETGLQNNPAIPYLVPTPAPTSLGDIAAGLEQTVYNNSVLAHLGISAVPGPVADQTPTAADFILQGGPADLTWAQPTIQSAAGAAGTEKVTITSIPPASSGSP